jgi:hypothetical protein
MEFKFNIAESDGIQYMLLGTSSYLFGSRRLWLCQIGAANTGLA